MMKRSRRTCLAAILLPALSIFGSATNDEPKMEEVIVEGEKYTIETYDGFVNLNEANRKGARLYKEGLYREAIP